MITSKKPINEGKYLMPLDMKMTLTVSMLMSQIRAPKMRRGTITKLKISGDMTDTAMDDTDPFYRSIRIPVSVNTILCTGYVWLSPGKSPDGYVVMHTYIREKPGGKSWRNNKYMCGK